VWRRLTRLLAKYPSAVLTFVAEDGYPVSFRCRPRVDPTGEVLVIEPPPSIRLREGRVGLLCHSHNEELWKLRSFHVRAALERRADRWVVVPERLTLGMGHGGLLAKVRLIRDGKRTAAAYLARRGWEEPPIDWHGFKEMKQDVFGSPSSDRLSSHV
jgi:hypothetical protein